MNCLLICTAVALFLGLTPALAADNNATVPGATDSSSGAAQQSSAPEGSKAAMDNSANKSGAALIPPEGSVDTSNGAAQQSSAPPSSAAADHQTLNKTAQFNNEPRLASGNARRSRLFHPRFDFEGVFFHEIDTLDYGGRTGNRLRRIRQCRSFRREA